MKPELSEVKMTFSQDADCCSSETQFIEIQTEDGGGGFYFVIKTERWAFDDPKELIDLLQTFIKKTEE